MSRYRVGVLSTHPIQYYAPWYRALAGKVDLRVFYCQRQTAEGQAAAGFGVEFDWDVPLLEGYSYRFLENRSKAPNVSSFSGCDTPEIYSAARRGGFDAFIIHGWYVKSFWQGMLACRRAGIPILVRGDSQLETPRGRLRRAIKFPLYRLFVPRLDGYLCVGERARRYYLHYGADRSRIFFVPHAVDNDFFGGRAAALRHRRGELRASFGLPADALVYLFAGKLIAKKRPADFLRALALASRPGGRLYGLVAGDGPLRAELEETVRREDLPVRFAGFLNQTQMPRAYAASDALVLPSDGGETWGLVVNEAMASGLPVLVSDRVGCAPDLARAGETGAVFRCGDVEGLASLLRGLSEGALRRLGVGARRVVEGYSIDRAVGGTIEALRAVGGRRRAAREADALRNPERRITGAADEYKGA